MARMSCWQFQNALTFWPYLPLALGHSRPRRLEIYSMTRQSEPQPSPAGHLSNAGTKRYLLEAESTTGFVAWKTADGTTLVSQSTVTSIAASPSLSFWSCAAYSDTTPAGEIVYFDCHGNELTELDVTGLKSLEYLDCSFNQLRKLSLASLTNLQALDGDNNALTVLDVRDLRALRVLNCARNQLTTLDLGGMEALQILDCSDNSLSILRWDGCSSLQDVNGARNPAIP